MGFGVEREDSERDLMDAEFRDCRKNNPCHVERNGGGANPNVMLSGMEVARSATGMQSKHLAGLVTGLVTGRGGAFC